MTRRRCVAFAVGIAVGCTLLVSPGSAMTVSAGPSGATCSNMNAPQYRLDRCEFVLYRRVESQMDDSLKRAAGRPRSAQVITSQKAWLSYRDTQCAAVEKFYAPGTIAPYEGLRCDVVLTKDRTDEIEALLPRRS